MISFLSRFLYILQNRRKELIVLTGLFLFVSVLEVFGTGIIGPFMALATNPNSVQENGFLKFISVQLQLSSNEQVIWLVGALLIITFYAKAFLAYRVQEYIFNFGFNQQGDLSCKLMRAYLAAPYPFHLSNNSANLIQNIVNEADRFANGLMMPLLTSISNALVVCSLVLLLIFTNPAATITIAGILGIAALFYQRLKNKLSYLGKEVSESRSEMIRVVNHSLGGIKETKVIGCEAEFEKQLEKQSKRYSHSVSLGLSITTLPRYLIESFLITFLILFTFIFIATNQGETQNLSSVLGIFALASIRLLPATSNLLSAVAGIKYNSYTVDRLYFDLKELDTLEVEQRQKAIALGHSSKHVQTFDFQSQIILDKVSYQYPSSERKALDQISLEIKKGQSIGLIGQSGSGKTTLVDVILGLLTPQTGDITVDGASVYQDLRAWQNLIGYVPQSIFLIDDSLARNIAFGVPDHFIDATRLQKAIQAAQLSDLVDQLPQGLQTIVGERGVLLSGGQRQRVGIARALYHEREILVFDEATAALDHETEALVTEAIKTLGGAKTIIIIAHRLSTIEHCDRIFKLGQGKILEAGSYQTIVLGKSNL